VGSNSSAGLATTAISVTISSGALSSTCSTASELMRISAANSAACSDCSDFLLRLGIFRSPLGVAALLAVSVTADLESIAETCRRCGWKNKLPVERFAPTASCARIYKE